MTIRQSIELECPECNAKQNVALYDSVNVSVDPDLKEKLFNGEINTNKSTSFLVWRSASDTLFFGPNFMNFGLRRRADRKKVYATDVVGYHQFLAETSKSSVVVKDGQ